MDRLDISVVVPLYNEAESLPELAEWVDRVMRENGFSYEMILIDDGSSDGSWKVVEGLKERYPAVRGIGFARNYGKSAALYCGFAAAEGEVVITMDADLQDSPDEIPELRRMILEEGYDLVSGWKKRRHDPVGKRWPSKFFNWTARSVSGIRLHDFNCGLKAYRRNDGVDHRRKTLETVPRPAFARRDRPAAVLSGDSGRYSRRPALFGGVFGGTYQQKLFRAEQISDRQNFINDDTTNPNALSADCHGFDGRHALCASGMVRG